MFSTGVAHANDDTMRRPRMSVAEYLTFEEKSITKYEYAAGYVREPIDCQPARPTEIIGETETHESIASNLHGFLWNHLKGHSCRVFKSDLKLRIQLVGNSYFYYPDLMVVCDPDDNESPLFKDRPLVLVEVTSPSSEERDREAKLFAYLSIPSLRSYLIVSHEKQQITHYRRTEAGWVPSHHPAAGNLIELPELGLSLTLDEIYDRTSVPA